MGVYPQVRRGQKHLERVTSREFATIHDQIRAIVNQFRPIKWEHRPRFDNMYMRKLFCLLYLESIQADKGEFSARDVYSFFLNNYKASVGYFEKMQREGWIIGIQRPKSRLKYLGILSPLSVEFLTLLRRGLENSKAVEGHKNGILTVMSNDSVTPVKNYPLIEDINQPSVIHEPITQARATDQVKQSPAVEPKESGQSLSDDLFNDVSDSRI